MKNKSKFLGIGLSMMVLLGFSTTASADPGEVIKSNVVDANVHSGGFNLVSSPIDSFGDITIKLSDQKYSTGFENDFTIKDLRGLDDNWQLSVSATSFKSLDNPNHEFKNVLSISPLSDIKRIGSTNYDSAPSMTLSTENVLDDGDVLIAKSEDGSGLGEFSLSFPDDALHLMVTPGMKEGAYSSTLTWTLMSVPS